MRYMGLLRYMKDIWKLFWDEVKKKEMDANACRCADAQVHYFNEF